MVLNYTPGRSARDRVRLLIGDTDPNAMLELRLEDDDIDDLLAFMTGSASPSMSGVYRVASRAAYVLAAKFARKAEGSTGPQSIRPSNRAQELRATARDLQQQASTMAVPYAGGISVSDKAAMAADTDRVRATFAVGMLDHPDGSDG